jgi:hypothetical protein
LTASELRILTGETALSTSSFKGLPVKRIILHPTYNSTTKENDIALIELSSPITFNSNRRAIALPEGPMPPAGTSATISGWGDTIWNVNSKPTVLQSASVNLVSDQRCLDVYGSKFFAQVMFCAGHPNFQVDTCQGDSGGPLAYPDPQLGWTLLGVTSWGTRCAYAPYPGVYTRVQFFRDWIAGYLPPPPVISSPSMVGKASSNSRLTIRSKISGKPTAVSYSWFRCQVPAANISDITGTCIDTGYTKDSILVDGANVGSYLVGRITASNSSGTTQAFTNNTGLILPGISGAAVPNKKLKFVLTGPVSWNSSFSYQWIRNGVPIAGQNGQSYSVKNGDRGKSITLQVQVSREGYTESFKSAYLKVGKQLPKAKFSSTGKPVFGETLKSTVTFGSLKPKVSYQWFRGGTPISRATKSSYRLTVADVGKKVHVVVSARLKGYATQEFKGKTSRSVSSAKFTKSTPAITGTFGVGRTLKASTGSVGASNAKKEYQWLRAGKTIDGATKSKYKLTRADAGKKISVRVKVTKAGYKTMSVTSPRLDSWVRETIKTTYHADSLPCVRIVYSFEPCNPGWGSSSGRGMWLYSDTSGRMAVASSIPTVGAVQKWRITFGDATTSSDTWGFAPTYSNYLSYDRVTILRQGERGDITTNWSTFVDPSTNRVHFAILGAWYSSMYYETVTIEYETIR